MVGSFSDCFKQAQPAGVRYSYLKNIAPGPSFNIYSYPKKKVFSYLNLKIPEILNCPDQNDYIVSYLENKLRIDTLVLAEIKENRFRSEQARVRRLIDIFSARSREDVMEFMQVLIDLKGQEVASGMIRDALNLEFPGIVESIKTNARRLNSVTGTSTSNVHMTNLPHISTEDETRSTSKSNVQSLTAQISSTYVVESEGAPCPVVSSNHLSDCNKNTGCHEADGLLAGKTLMDPENCKTSPTNGHVWYRKRRFYVGMPILFLFLAALVTCAVMWGTSGESSVKGTGHEHVHNFVTDKRPTGDSEDILSSTTSSLLSTYSAQYAPSQEKSFTVFKNEENGKFRFKVIPKNSNKYGGGDVKN